MESSPIVFLHRPKDIHKSLKALLLFITVLHRARGNQIETYGHAVFGLTVTPNAFMSFLDIMGNLLTPTSSSVYLVANDGMEDSRHDGGSFDGVVGRIGTQKLLSSSPICAAFRGSASFGSSLGPYV